MTPDITTRLDQVHDLESLIALLRDAHRALDDGSADWYELTTIDHAIPDWDGQEMRTLAAAPNPPD